MEQSERLEISGHFINSLINSKPGKKLNLAQMQREANETYMQGQRDRDHSSSPDKIYKEAEVQTTPTENSPMKEADIYNVVRADHEPEQTRLNHVLSIAG